MSEVMDRTAPVFLSEMQLDDRWPADVVTQIVPPAAAADWLKDGDIYFVYADVPSRTKFGHSVAERVDTAGESRWGVAFETLMNVLDLEENWDSHGARPVDWRTVLRSLRFLRGFHQLHTVAPPSVVPTSAGGVQFEWH